MRPVLFAVAALGVIIGDVSAGGQYWWMNQPDAFSGSSGGYNNRRPQQQQQQQPQQQQQQQQQQYYPNDNQISESVQTECPAGTKCVSDFFCDENAVMVNYRVDLTPQQKKSRGTLASCTMPGNGNLGVCCAMPANAPPAVAQAPRPQQQFQQQAPAANIPQGSCPNLGAIPPVESCNGLASNCWSVGQADVDCPNNALCCFDGCRNACYFGASSGSSAILPAPAPAARPPPPRVVPAPAPAPVPQQPRRPAPAFPQPQPQQPSYPQQQYVPQQQQQYAPQPQQQFTPQQQQQQFSPPRQPQPPAETKPYVTCPAAMKCVLRDNCDINGVMTDQVVRLSPDAEMQRVPLIPCISPNNGNVDVCCRDPNYKDPWPGGMMSGNTFDDGSQFQQSQPQQNFAPQQPQQQNFAPAPQQNFAPAPAPSTPKRRTGYGK